MIFETMLAAIGSGVVSGGAVGVIAKKWMDYSFSVRLAEIEAKNQILAHEHQVRFTRYDEKVTEVIEGAYAIVCEYLDAITEALSKAAASGGQGELEPPEAVSRRFATFMQRQSIYLPEDVAQKLVSVRAELRDAYAQQLTRLRNGSELSGSVLDRVYRNAEFQRQAEDILWDLQELARQHLRRFTVSD
ncbi:hypothetical protein BBB39_13065 [Bordetella trematum]|uniref:Uncharacterized protein n=1 Tax=Bordetella trematum TaxID=123899 RepID=A0A157STW0_9BORD|nr:hypothetical protein [Bordetella trematum]AZR94605.1 hypothetical protein BBB39_13065 [Bordetella trematum]NNH19124.1 hypothetical protein [Bordetella trematum]SAI58648.1 Uncharacterised protein [Bordetella trematum]SAI73879.1 Uncharacterised protein [Bordetella trematum]SUV97155.1 Uncharacterised protein [Bordetella trematum]